MPRVRELVDSWPMFSIYFPECGAVDIEKCVAPVACEVDTMVTTLTMIHDREVICTPKERQHKFMRTLMNSRPHLVF